MPTTAEIPIARCTLPQPVPVSLIGAPTDAGAGSPGARLGPDALRIAGLAQALARQAERVAAVADRGNLAGPPNPQQPARDGHRHLAEVAAWCGAVRDAVASELALGRLPVLMGGDHSLAIGSVSAVARHCRGHGLKLRVLWLDAHADFNTPHTTPSGHLHGMPVAVLCGLGPAALTALAGPVPALRAAELRQVGIRSVDAAEKRLVHAAGLEVYDMRHIDEHGLRATMAQALADVDEHTHLHVSLDVDFLDPAIAPAVATTVPGGPTWREAQLCMEMIADTGRLGSLDLMELNPALDIRNQTAGLVVDLVESLFGKSTLMRPR
jgi:arginase